MFSAINLEFPRRLLPKMPSKSYKYYVFAILANRKATLGKNSQMLDFGLF